MSNGVEDRAPAAIEATVGHLAARWSSADKQVLRSVFPLLASGAPVEIEHIAAAGGASRDAVEEALTRGRAGRDAAGRVVELSGMALEPTMHRLVIDGVALFGCCALLSHLTAFLLEREVSLESIDPVTRRIVRLAISPEKAIAQSPDAVATLVVTTSDAMARDVAASFCTHVFHFSNRRSADEFAAAGAPRYVVPIEVLHDAARQLYLAAWSPN